MRPRDISVVDEGTKIIRNNVNWCFDFYSLFILSIIFIFENIIFTTGSQSGGWRKIEKLRHKHRQRSTAKENE